LLFVVHNSKEDNAQTRDQTQKTPPDYAQAFNAGEDASGEKMQQMIDAARQAFREVGQEWEKKGWSPTRSTFFLPLPLSPPLALILKGKADVGYHDAKAR